MSRLLVAAARKLSLGLCCLVCVSYLLMPADARAQDTRERVERLLAAGMEQREAGRDAEALEFFRRALELQPDNPRVLSHLGATYQALGRWVLSHTYLKQALAYEADPYVERHRPELEEALTTVDDHLGYLEVYGAPAGSEASLNGQLLATLPMASPVPVIVGSYLLEVRFAGHYTVGRPVTISKRGLTREEVELTPHRAGNALPAANTASAASTSAPVELTREGEERTLDATSGAPRWLPWTLGGLSMAAGATSVVAWRLREGHAERWNDDARCLGVGVTRQARCGGELSSGQRAETVMWMSGAAAGLLAAGAVVSAFFIEPAEQQLGVAQCVPSLGGVACFGSF